VAAVVDLLHDTSVPGYQDIDQEVTDTPVQRGLRDSSEGAELAFDQAQMPLARTVLGLSTVGNH
jgi:hypothetical protein